MKEKELMVLKCLRGNARIKLTGISRKLNIPVSTAFDCLKRLEKECVIRYSVLCGFSKLGYFVRMAFIVKSNGVTDAVLNQKNVNCISSIKEESQYFIEALFRDLAEAEKFREFLQENNFVVLKEICMIKELKKEELKITAQDT